MPEGMIIPAESDVRFQFDVIRNLAESVRQQSEVLRGVQQTQITMLERLARIEANRVNETVAKLEERVEKALEKIDALESDRDRREGAIGVLGWLAKNWPFAVVSAALGVLVAWANGKFGR